jgi:hypothetical protein
VENIVAKYCSDFMQNAQYKKPKWQPAPFILPLEGIMMNTLDNSAEKRQRM